MRVVPQSRHRHNYPDTDWRLMIHRPVAETGRSRALKLWFTVHAPSFRSNWASRAHSPLRCAGKQTEELLEKDGCFWVFKLFVRAHVGLVCFYVALGGRELNEALLRRVNESGKAFLIHSLTEVIHENPKWQRAATV
ncbi:hypothetical protein PHYPSEUDO_015162 [Phytophthora pseudosyringae]|uniref:Uncharacterized protein n=1 Tax=Phytophthora pseudosyringae TaxID=221518 RepID=A0A8T1VZB3_9STRA|nr:hypothetical protein PHYPSEUDO_015162 [Phytophthora pseudosyringae]